MTGVAAEWGVYYGRVVSMPTVSWEQEQGQVELQSDGISASAHGKLGHPLTSELHWKAFYFSAVQLSFMELREQRGGRSGEVMCVLKGSSPLLSARAHADAAAVSGRRVVAGTLAQLEARAAGCAALSP